MTYRLVSRSGALLATMAALVGASPARVWAQAPDTTARPSPIASANKAFTNAKTRLAQHDTAGALAAFKEAIEADPNYTPAHEQFTSLTRTAMSTKSDDPDARHRATTAATDTLAKQYSAWTARFPSSAG